jgi:hypothetical protein
MIKKCIEKSITHEKTFQGIKVWEQFSYKLKLILLKCHALLSF